jgi:hypothetical protein
MGERGSRTITLRWVVLLLILAPGLWGRAAVLNQAAPFFQSGSEVEPNDTPAEANPILVNERIVGMIPGTNPSDIDYFVLSTESGRRYEVRLDEEPVSNDYRFSLALYDSNQNLIDESETSGGTTFLEWTADTDQYYFSVEAVEIDVDDAPYAIRVVRFGLTPTPTSPPGWDDCEINDTLIGAWSSSVPPGGPCPISVGAVVEDLNFVPFTGQPAPNPDYFLVSVKAGRNYRLETVVTAGVDTVVFLYPPGATDDSQFIASNDDAPGLGLGSRIEWTPAADGSYTIKVENLEPLPHDNIETYDLVVRDVSPTATPTFTPIATSTPGTPTATPTRVTIPGNPDAFEPNYNFDRATLIGLGTKYTNLNFVPWTGTGVDNDFYKLWVVAGKLYTCQTLDLGTASNTNMILYSCPGEQCGFAGNDNVEPFDPNDPYRSRITFFSSYAGYLYLLVGQVGADRILPEEWSNLSYGLECFIEQPGTATPTPTGAFVPTTPNPTNTPAPAQTLTPAVPAPTATPVPLVVLPMTTPTRPSAAGVPATPTPQLLNIQLLLYYDRNGNGQADPGEGIRDILARAYDAASGELLSIDYTDESGFLRFTLPRQVPVRVSVPFFGFEQIVTQNNASIQIRIAPR